MNKLKDINDSLIKGREVFESIPSIRKNSWLLMILRKALEGIEELPKPIQDLYQLMSNQEELENAYQLFYDIRAFSLENLDFEPQDLLNLAEQIAKVLYNETRPKASFDIDSGWKIEFFVNQLGFELVEEDIFKLGKQ